MKQGTASLALAATLVGGLYLAAQPQPARAGFPVPTEVTCAVGGEEFTYTTTPSYTIYGRRPDGRPVGSWTFPFELPDCPANRLVMYDDFDAAELAVLEELLASEEYAALHGESTYCRAAWLEARMPEPDGDLIDYLMLQATWQVDDQPERKARYQREFAERAEAKTYDTLEPEGMIMALYGLNARRDLGEFDRAYARAMEFPKHRPAHLDEATGPEAEEQKEVWDYIFTYLDAQIALIDAEDASAEPADWPFLRD